MTDHTGQLSGMRALVAEIEYLSGGRRGMELIFGDERWDYRQGYDPRWNADRWFLQFLSWGPWTSPWPLWKRINAQYEMTCRPIGRMTSEQAGRIVYRGIDREGHGFQRTVKGYLVALNDRLSREGIGMRAFEQRIRGLGWRRGRVELRKWCGIADDRHAKILDCWIRDRLRLLSFPVDSVVRSVVTDTAYGLPDDPDELVELTREVGRNPRIVARATWHLGGALLD
jgi:hypothetical protein